MGFADWSSVFCCSSPLTTGKVRGRSLSHLPWVKPKAQLPSRTEPASRPPQTSPET